MKNKAFNQTVALSSTSLDFSQDKSIEASSLVASLDSNKDEVIKAEANQQEHQDLITPSSDHIVSPPQVNTMLNQELDIQEQAPVSADGQIVSHSLDQKVYDRFKRTVEINTLELFEGDSNSAGAAWMIRDQDDVIEHRERLGLDNSEFYKDGLNSKKILVILILVVSALTTWYMFTEI